MPSTPELYYYPPLSDLMTVDDLPEILSFIQGAIDQAFDNAFYMYQSYLTANLVNGPNLDLSNDNRFRVNNTITPPYGKYIYKNQGPPDPYNDKALYEDFYDTGSYLGQFHRDLKTAFLYDPSSPTNIKYSNYYAIFIFDNSTYDNAVGQIEGIGVHNLTLFASRGNKTIIHESLHGFGLNHAFRDGSAIIFEPTRKYIFTQTNTDNFMSYSQNNRKTIWKWQWKIILSRL